MKMSKQSQVPVYLDLQKLAVAIAKEVVRELGGKNIWKQEFQGSWHIPEDERLLDVGISTDGMILSGSESVGQTTVKEDNISSATEKLKQLKKKE